MNSPISETAQRILSELEEARFEDIITLLQTVTDRTGLASELAQFLSALRELLQQSCVNITPEARFRDPYTPLERSGAEALLSQLPELVYFDKRQFYWLYRAEDGPPFTMRYPGLKPTDLGLTIAREILEARGYQWWRKP